MRKLKIIEHISLDGIMQVTRCDDDFPYDDWTAPYRTPEGRDAVAAAQGDGYDLLLGRRTYDSWSGYWPTAPRSPIADNFNSARKYVVTNRSEGLEWGPAEVVRPGLIEGVRRLKEQGGPDLILSGSCSLTSPLLEAELADEVVLIMYPVLIGTGKRLFVEGTPARAFELLSTQTTSTGIIFSTYKVVGPLKAG